MRNLFLSILLLLSCLTIAQPTPTGTQGFGQIKMYIPVLGAASDSLVVWNGSDKLMKFVPRSLTVPTLQEVLTAGNTAVDKYIILNSSDTTQSSSVNVAGFNTTFNSGGIYYAGILTPQYLVLASEPPFSDLNRIDTRFDRISRIQGDYQTDLTFTTPTANNEIIFPNGNGTFTLSVRGNSPDTSGDIDLPHSTLQESTDAGNTTTNSIIITDGTTTNTISKEVVSITSNGATVNHNVQIDGTTTSFYGETSNGNSVSVGAYNTLGPNFSGTIGDAGFSIRATNLTGSNQVGLEVPNKSSGDYTIATIDDLSSKQDVLVSGTNIKTVNSTSLLGSGNLAVGDALVVNPLSQFASTTSAQLAGVISNETGTGFVVFSDSPTLSGTPKAPTQSANDNTTKIATTAYADAKVANTITDGVTTIAPSENAVFDALALKTNANRFVFQNTTSITGVTGENVVTSFKIPAGAYTSNDGFTFSMSMDKSTTALTVTYKVYVGTTANALTQQVAQAVITGANRRGDIVRYYIINGGNLDTSVNFMSSAQSGLSGLGSPNTPYAVTMSNDLWFTVTANPTVITETTGVLFTSITPLK